MKILLLEDDSILSSTLVKLLELEDYDVSLAIDGNEVLELTYENKYDLYLFDINVPYISGTDLLKELRDSGDTTPTFFISALIDIESISNGFDVGCDDYIKKPFDFDELLIRIKSILKKSYGDLKYKDLKYNPTSKEILKDSVIIDMGLVETAIFELFIKNISSIVTKNDIFDVMDNPTDVALRAQISRIKKTLDLDITNIRGIGYRLEKV